MKSLPILGMNSLRPAFLKTILTACLLAGLLLAVAACDDTFIDPFDNDERYYTIYGFLDAVETEHAVDGVVAVGFKMELR